MPHKLIHCQHGIEFDDPDGPCEDCHPAPNWVALLPSMQAKLDAMSHRIDLLEAQCQSRK